MATCLPLTLFLRKPRLGDDACNTDSPIAQDSLDVHGQHSDFTFDSVVYLIPASPPAGEQEGEVFPHSCDYTDANQRCIALPKPMPGFLVSLLVEDPARTGRQTVKLVSPCWKRVADAVRDITFVVTDAATDQLVAARPGSFYKATMLVPQAILPRLTGNADRDWGAILLAFDAQGYGMNMEILIGRVPDCIS
ncbi:hypothetical protein PG985_002778 [Apiospora marii]|uniref:Uncharacterized protein n=1 Tax=Apiospora marii TaxID=335849 RepID=A0ABR1RTR2_9PEZI